ncbi:MAG TPA: cupin domain-containing protein [Caulobacteraceae bacterium]
MRLTADDVVRLLNLQPHPEGGWYRETFRDVAGPDGRARSTAIYYLLAQGQRSHWHRVTDAAEVWCFHAGDPLDLDIAPPAGARAERLVLGADLGLGEQPQAVAPAGWWQSATCLGDWSLVSCTVAPGFEFSSFEMAPAGWEPG